MAHLQGHRARPGLRVNGEVSGLLGDKGNGPGSPETRSRFSPERQKNKTKHSLPLYCKYNLERQFSVQIYIKKNRVSGNKLGGKLIKKNEGKSLKIVSATE